jgi:peptide chain release factor 2
MLRKVMQDRQSLVDAIASYEIGQELSDHVELIEMGEMEDDAGVVTTEAERWAEGLGGESGRRTRRC